jgi:hypothetical protein
VVYKQPKKVTTCNSFYSLYITPVKKSLLENSSSKIQDQKDERRLKPSLLPMFKDLTQQAYEAHLIRQPRLVNLAKFSLSFFAEMWLQQKAAQA